MELLRFPLLKKLRVVDQESQNGEELQHIQLLKGDLSVDGILSGLLTQTPTEHCRLLS
jgi:hypothetical protein